MASPKKERRGANDVKSHWVLTRSPYTGLSEISPYQKMERGHSRPIFWRQEATDRQDLRKIHRPNTSIYTSILRPGNGSQNYSLQEGRSTIHLEYILRLFGEIKVLRCIQYIMALYGSVFIWCCCLVTVD